MLTLERKTVGDPPRRILLGLSPEPSSDRVIAIMTEAVGKQTKQNTNKAHNALLLFSKLDFQLTYTCNEENIQAVLSLEKYTS